MTTVPHENRRSLDAEMDDIAERAAIRALTKSWLILGVDIANPDSVIALQADFRHVRLMREVSTKMGSRAAGMVWTALFGALLLWLLQKAGIPVSKLFDLTGP